MKTTQKSITRWDRYAFSLGTCSSADGFAQVDTDRDDEHHGVWCSPARRTVVEYCEGKVTTTVCESDAELASYLRTIEERNTERDCGWMRIDPGANHALREAFEALGVADLLAAHRRT